jgi:hypothetical protein
VGLAIAGATRETGGVGCWACGLVRVTGVFPFAETSSGCDWDTDGSGVSKDPGRDVVGVNGVSFDRVHSRAEMLSSRTWETSSSSDGFSGKVTFRLFP